jgi:hypothetical protein
VLETEGQIYGGVDTKQTGVFAKAMANLVKEGRMTETGARVSQELSAGERVQAKTKQVMELNAEVVKELQSL